jgi:2,3-dihydroxyphenylpropionate 1,2-dioxygenase
MSSIALGIAASHTTLMNTHWNAVKHIDRAERFRDALAAACARVKALEPDVAVIIGSNHFRGFYLDLVPAFTIGVGECIASGESGTPSGPQKVDTALARHIAEFMVADDLDIAFSAKLQVDHGITHALQYVLAGVDIPIVPIVINVFAPPLPSVARCAHLGETLARAIDSFAGNRKVAVIASGGLSHHLPWPDWRAPADDDDEFLVEAWLNGRTRWKDYEARRREIVLKATASSDDRFQINGDFDRDFLAQVEAGKFDALLGRSTEDLQVEAGNGGQEIRAWVAMAAALHYAPGKVLAYEAIPEWLTGMAVAVVEPTRAAA